MTQIDIQSATLSGDAVTITGTVDGVEVVVSVWKSHLDTLATKPLKRSYVAAQLKAAAPAAPATIDLTGAVITL